MNMPFKPKNCIIAGILLLFNALSLKGQENLDRILNRMELQLDNFKQEKVYIHTDKTEYISGDTLWYRCYLADANSHTEIKAGFNLYLQLINPSGITVKQTILKPNGKGYYGYIALNRELAEGKYLLKTSAVSHRGTKPDCYFIKEIRISNLLSALIKSKTDFTFKNNGQKISAKITLTNTQNGQGIDSKYMNVDYQNSPLLVKTKKNTAQTTFLTKENIEPLSIQLGNWEQFVPVPFANDEFEVAFFPEGGPLLTGTECKVGFKAFTADRSGEEISGEIIDGQGRTITQFQSLYKGTGVLRFTPQEGKTYQAVCRNREGIVKQIPLPEPVNRGRSLTTAWNGEKLEIRVKEAGNLSSADPLYLFVHTRGIVQYFDKLQPGNLHLSIPKRFLQSGVLQVLLLDDKLNPLSERLVFCNKNDQAHISFEPDKPVYSAREPVKVTLTIEDSGKLPVNGSVSVSVTNDGEVQQDGFNNLKTALLLSSELNDIIETPGFYFGNDDSPAEAAREALLLTLQWRRYDIPAALQGQSPEIAYSEGSPTDVYIRSTFGNDSVALVNAALRYQYRTGKPLAYEAPRSKKQPGKLNTDLSSSDHSISSDEILKHGYKSVAEALRSTSGVQVESDQKIYIRNTYTLNPFKKTIKATYPDSETIETGVNPYKISPVFMLDGVNSSITAINTIPMDNIAKIEVYKGGGGLTLSHSSGGVIAVTTKRSLLGNTQPVQTVPRMGKNDSLETTNKTAEFYSPAYAHTPDHKTPDLRSTVYWNPDVPVTDGKGEFSFYTSDDCQSGYTVQIEGLSDEGVIILKTAKIKLSKH